MLSIIITLQMLAITLENLSSSWTHCINHIKWTTLVNSLSHQVVLVIFLTFVCYEVFPIKSYSGKWASKQVCYKKTNVQDKHLTAIWKIVLPVLLRIKIHLVRWCKIAKRPMLKLFYTSLVTHQNAFSMMMQDCQMTNVTGPVLKGYLLTYQIK